MFNKGNSGKGNGSGIAPGVSARVINGLRAYWEARRTDGQLPGRADIDPRGIEHALEYSFILERVAPGIGRFRVAGMYMNDLMGMEVRGMPLTTFFVPEARRRITEATETVFAGPAIVSAHLEGETGYGRPALNAHMLLLPLRSDLGDVTRALGCIVAQGQIGRVPRRFGIDTMRTERIETAPQQTLSFGEAPPVFTKKPADTPEERRRMFRLISRD